MSTYPDHNRERSNNYAHNEPSDNSHPKIERGIAPAYIARLSQPRRSVCLAGSDRENGYGNHHAPAQEKRNDMKWQKIVGGVHAA
jgi:hypothetical protein